LKCNRGYTLVNGTCAACATNCDNCDINNQAQCDYGRCALGYGVTNSGNGAGLGNIICNKCNLGCMQCDNDTNICTSCSDETWLLIDNSTNTSTCTLCETGC
jgi:hypothetical protein